MFGICLPYTTNGSFRNQWAYLLDNFLPDALWVIGAPVDDRDVIYKKFNPTHIETAEDLPVDSSLVILAPRLGRYVQGDQSLLTFQHPVDAIYLFGPENSHLSEDELGERLGDHLVYIPTSTDVEMYSWTCGSAVFWDRLLKSSGT